ncbi:EAL domain-containing protein [Pallidibacillus pasinlerensis]|uniref:EAL domain-containing protein n=1 Tax=Pallidibacillus pasinlerensis TaxID=2703818 RepID=A0ABX0A6P4_9BACI|nr:EAL domain-containing protein [Pallidibacillus pasinlerensis]NCU18201.1 EAL domain-containing protein [Pallidibacillus pasinlerensis]
MNITIAPTILRDDLHDAIKNNALHIEYQPKINISEGKIAGSEALLRWKHPQYGNVSPGIFIPLVMEYGLNGKMMELVVNTVCEQVKQWERDNVPVKGVSFNLSPKSFLNPTLVKTIHKIFQHHCVSPDIFEIEITEEAILHKTDIVNQQFSQLRELGFSFALDDLGKGYTSFTTLSEFPFDTVKFDRSFIRDIECSYDNRYIVKSFIEMSKRMGKKTVAEGVETKNQLTILQELNCDEIQGFYYSPSVSGEEMANWYKLERVSV